MIWSVSMASSFAPGCFGSQKMRAFPRTSRDPPGAAPTTDRAARAAIVSRVTPGFRRTDWIGIVIYAPLS